MATSNEWMRRIAIATESMAASRYGVLTLEDAVSIAGGYRWQMDQLVVVKSVYLQYSTGLTVGNRRLSVLALDAADRVFLNIPSPVVQMASSQCRYCFAELPTGSAFLNNYLPVTLPSLALLPGETIDLVSSALGGDTFDFAVLRLQRV